MDYNWISGGFRDELHNIGFRTVDYNWITIGLQMDYNWITNGLQMDYNWITIGLRNELHKHKYATKSGLQLDYGCLTKT